MKYINIYFVQITFSSFNAATAKPVKITGLQFFDHAITKYYICASQIKYIITSSHFYRTIWTELRFIYKTFNVSHEMERKNHTYNFLVQFKISINDRKI